MLYYLLKKTLWLLSTLLLVSILCFFLSKNMPDDPVAKVLLKRGMNPLDTEMTFYQKAYDKLSKKLGHNLPQFYFSIKPSFSNHLLDPEWSEQKKNLARKLSSKRYAVSDIHNYLLELDELVLKLKKNANEEGLRTSSYLLNSYELSDINNHISRLKNTPLSLEADQLISSIQGSVALFDEHKEIFYYPSISWNGFNNQYHKWVINILQSDYGVSIIDGKDVGEKMFSALKWTLSLVFFSIVFSLIIGIPLAIFLNRLKKKRIKKGILIALYGMYSMPVFWTASLFIVFFTTKEYGVWTDIFPSPIASISESSGFIADLVENSKLLILPVICLVISNVPEITRLLGYTLEVESNKPYVQALYAKGQSEKNVFYKHLMPNSLFPLITMLGNYLPGSLAGSLVIEIIFNIPGMGRLLFNSVFNADTNITFGILLLIAVVTSIVLVVSDLFYKWANPRIESLT